jgi:Flp pilus assembly protein TadG
MSVVAKFRKWLFQESDEPRRAPRSREPEVVVYYWDGSVPEGRRIRDISASGAYIYTPERWYPGTIVRIILQGYPRPLDAGGVAPAAASICIPARVVRVGTDGVAVEFVFNDKKDEESVRTFLLGIPAQPPSGWPANPVAGAKSAKRGQGLIEFALIIPLIFLLAVNALNFGGFLYAWITVANAARDGAQYMAMSSASPGQPGAVDQAKITTLVTADVLSLLNRSSVTVSVCYNPAIPALSTHVCALSDPEAGYTLGAVDVTYTYLPFIPLFSFPALGIMATLPSSTIHRKAVMRMIQ